jgi:hypothetical protein
LGIPKSQITGIYLGEIGVSGNKQFCYQGQLFERISAIKEEGSQYFTLLLIVDGLILLFSSHRFREMDRD